MSAPLLALTLIQPWAHAILHMGKRVENRAWAPNPRTLPPGGWFAIHAGAKLEKETLLDLREDFPDAPAEVSRSAIVGLARLEKIVRSGAEVPVDQRIWWNGPIGWLLSEVRLINPIPCKGMMGLWTVPPALRSAIEVPR